MYQYNITNTELFTIHTVHSVQLSQSGRSPTLCKAQFLFPLHQGSNPANGVWCLPYIAGLLKDSSACHHHHQAIQSARRGLELPPVTCPSDEATRRRWAFCDTHDLLYGGSNGLTLASSCEHVRLWVGIEVTSTRVCIIFDMSNYDRNICRHKFFFELYLCITAWSQLWLLDGWSTFDRITCIRRVM